MNAMRATVSRQAPDPCAVAVASLPHASTRPDRTDLGSSGTRIAGSWTSRRNSLALEINMDALWNQGTRFPGLNPNRKNRTGKIS
jgi:hypothetical protein